METSIAPLLTVSDAKAAADFYKLAFRAKEVARHDAGEQRIVVEMEIEGAPFVIVDENPAALNLSPQSLKGTSVRISLLVDDPDAVFDRALNSGEKSCSRWPTSHMGCAKVVLRTRSGITGW